MSLESVRLSLSQLAIESTGHHLVSGHLQKEYQIAELRRKSPFDFVQPRDQTYTWRNNNRTRTVRILNFTAAKVSVSDENGKIHVRIADRNEANQTIGNFPPVCLDDESYTKIECMIFSSLKVEQMCNDIPDAQSSMQVYGLMRYPNVVIRLTLWSDLKEARMAFMKLFMPTDEANTASLLAVTPTQKHSRVGFASDQEFSQLVRATRMYVTDAGTSYVVIDLKAISDSVKSSLSAFIEAKGGATLPSDSLLQGRFLVLHSLNGKKYVSFLVDDTSSVTLDRALFRLGTHCGHPLVPAQSVLQNDQAIGAFYRALDTYEITLTAEKQAHEYPISQIALYSKIEPVKKELRDHYFLSRLKHWYAFDSVRPTQDFTEGQVHFLNFTNAPVQATAGDNGMVRVEIRSNGRFGTFEAVLIDKAQVETVIVRSLKKGENRESELRIHKLLRGTNRILFEIWNSAEKIQSSSGPKKLLPCQNYGGMYGAPPCAVSHIGLMDDDAFQMLVKATRLFHSKVGASIALIDLAAFPQNYLGFIKEILSSFIETTDGAPHKVEYLEKARFLLLYSMDQKSYVPFPIGAGTQSIDDVTFNFSTGWEAFDKTQYHLKTSAKDCVVQENGAPQLTFDQQDESRITAFYQQIEKGQISWKAQKETSPVKRLFRIRQKEGTFTAERERYLAWCAPTGAVVMGSALMPLFVSDEQPHGWGQGHVTRKDEGGKGEGEEGTYWISQCKCPRKLPIEALVYKLIVRTSPKPLVQLVTKDWITKDPPEVVTDLEEVQPGQSQSVLRLGFEGALPIIPGIVSRMQAIKYVLNKWIPQQGLRESPADIIASFAQDREDNARAYIGRVL